LNNLGSKWLLTPALSSFGEEREKMAVVSSCTLIAAGGDNDVEMDGGPVKDGDMDSRGQPALPPEKVNLCQQSGPVYE
jgi:hypothetical protein